MLCKEKLIIAIAISFMVFYCLGAFIGKATFEPKVITQTETLVQTVTEYQTVEKIVHVDKPVVEYVEKIVEIPIELRDFETREELRQWLGRSQLILKFRQQPEADCDDFAFQLQERALRDGYRVNVELIEAREYNELFKKAKLGSGKLHAINLVFAGNKAYYIEPQTYEIVFVANID